MTFIWVQLFHERYLSREPLIMSKKLLSWNCTQIYWGQRVERNHCIWNKISLKCVYGVQSIDQLSSRRWLVADHSTGAIGGGWLQSLASDGPPSTGSYLDQCWDGSKAPMCPIWYKIGLISRKILTQSQLFQILHFWKMWHNSTFTIRSLYHPDGLVSKVHYKIR